MKIDLNFIDSLLSFGETLSKVVLDIQSRDFEVTYKEDQSPLTEADTTSNAMILEFLRSKTSVSNIISEENQSISYESR